MKKITLLTAFLCLVYCGNAQVNMGARLGMNLGLFEMQHKDLGTYDVVPRPNVLLGLDIDVPFSMVFSFRTGISMVQKAIEVDLARGVQNVSNAEKWSALYRMNYLELPLFLAARAETDFGNFYLSAGPTFSLGVGGDVSVDTISSIPDAQGKKPQGSYPSQKLKWDGKHMPTLMENYYHFKRFDFGLGAAFTYQLPRTGIAITVNYNKGFRNIATNPDNTIKTSYVGVSVGFFMGG